MSSSERKGLPRWAWLIAGAALVGLAVYALRGALTPIFFAFLIAYFFDPLVDRFEARGVPRAIGITIVLALTLGGFALVLLLVVPGVVHEVRAFAHELPARTEAIRRGLEPRLAQYGVEIPHSFEELRQLGLGSLAEEGTPTRGGSARELASHAGSVLGAVGEWIWGRTTSVLAVIGTVLIVPVFAFYLLHDFDRITAGIRDLVPWRYRGYVVQVAKEIDQVLGQFVRGQLLVMLILAVLYSAAYSALGVRLAIPIGIVAGVLSFIPYVGGGSALLLALLMCALSWQGWGQVVGVSVAYGVIQLLEGFVITPRIVGDKVGLPAVWVLVALMLGGEILGFFGVLIALPAAAVVKIFVVRALAVYRESRLFADGAPQDDLAPNELSPNELGPNELGEVALFDPAAPAPDVRDAEDVPEPSAHGEALEAAPELVPASVEPKLMIAEGEPEPGEQAAPEAPIDAEAEPDDDERPDDAR